MLCQGEGVSDQTSCAPTPTRGGRTIRKVDADERKTLSPLRHPFWTEPQSSLVHCPYTSQEKSGRNMEMLKSSTVEVPALTSQTLLAKFYDPLYYKHGHTMHDINSEPFRCAGHDYSHEAAAYRALHNLEGTIVPKYYGSYTCELVTLGETRSVRLILIKFVLGSCMPYARPHTACGISNQKTSNNPRGKEL